MSMCVFVNLSGFLEQAYRPSVSPIYLFDAVKSKVVILINTFIMWGMFGGNLQMGKGSINGLE